MTDHLSILCMKNGICRILTVLAILLSAAGCRNSGNSSFRETADGENLLPDWALGGFVWGKLLLAKVWFVGGANLCL